jgi:hypothetical protein
LSTILATILLIALVVAGVVSLTGVWNTIFGGASSSVSLTDEGSVITVNTATDSGMILIVIRNNGPGTFNLASVNITAATGQDVIITPSSNTEATFGGAMQNSTGSVNGGVGVGYLASGNYLTIPPGQSASFRATVPSGLAELFPPDQNFQLLVTPRSGSLIRLTVQSISQ